MNKKYEKYRNVIIWVIHSEATPEQMKMVRLWREADPDHERFFRETEKLKRLLCRSSALPPFDAEREWMELMLRIPHRRVLFRKTAPSVMAFQSDRFYL